MADIDALIAALTLEEKASLTAGSGIMATTGVGRLGVPVINVTDGPCGARGLSFAGVGGSAATCVPCGSAVGATWDPAIAEQIGAFVTEIQHGCRMNNIDYVQLRTDAPLGVALSSYLAHRLARTK